MDRRPRPALVRRRGGGPRVAAAGPSERRAARPATRSLPRRRVVLPGSPTPTSPTVTGPAPLWPVRTPRFRAAAYSFPRGPLRRRASPMPAWSCLAGWVYGRLRHAGPHRRPLTRSCRPPAAGVPPTSRFLGQQPALEWPRHPATPDPPRADRARRLRASHRTLHMRHGLVAVTHAPSPAMPRERRSRWARPTAPPCITPWQTPAVAPAILAPTGRGRIGGLTGRPWRPAWTEAGGPAARPGRARRCRLDRPAAASCGHDLRRRGVREPHRGHLDPYLDCDGRPRQPGMPCSRR